MAHCKSNELTEEGLAYRSTTEEFTLYVNDLPVELNELGLLQIFNHYGNVIGHFYRPNSSWAFITYSKSDQADNAIRDLHNVSPLYLKVSYAKPKVFKNIYVSKAYVPNNVEQGENNIVSNIESIDKTIVQTNGRGKLLDIFKNIEPNVGFPKYTCTANDDLLYPYPTDPHTFNPYENENYSNTNTLWTRGQLTITQDGKRHVSLGRGYTMYEIPDLDPEVQNRICKVYEKRVSGLYEYGKDMLQNAIGKCEKCSKLTKFNCKRCFSFYCSRNCAMADWPQHKIECQAIPSLVPAVNSIHLTQQNSGNQTPTRSTASIQLPLRRPKNLTDKEASSNQNVSKDKDVTDIPTTTHNDNAKNTELKYLHTNTPDQYNGYQKNEATEKISIPLQDRTNFQSNRVIANNLKIESKYTIQSKNTEEQNSSTFKKPLDTESIHSQNSCSDNTADNRNSDSFGNIIKKRQNFSADDVTKIEEDIAFTKQIFLSKTKFTDVRIIVKENCEYWIQKVEDSENIVKLMTDLQNDAEKAAKVKPVVGDIYAVQYEDVWHRGLVTCLNPLTIHYIDYGNDEVIQSDDFREVNKYKNIPRFAAKIRLSEKANKIYKDLKYEDIISVKMISFDSDKIINVEIEGENNASTSQVDQLNTSTLNVPKDLKSKNTVVSTKALSNNESSISVSKLKSVVNTVSAGETGFLEIHAELNNNIYSITLLPNSAITSFEKLLSVLPLECEQMKKENFSYRPQVRDIICGQRFDGDWFRGYILSDESPLKMAIIDEARMMPITKAVPCSNQFLQICAFGATCEIINAKYKFKASDHYEFKVVTQKGQNEIEIEISKDNDKLKAVVKPWVPMPEQKGIQYGELKSGSEVCITAYRSHIHLFARSLENEDVEYYNHVMQNVAKCAQTARLLKEPPVVGQMVIAQYVDDNYYRAIVTNVQDEKITISYVDFGNIENTNIKKLKILSDDLKQLRSCTRKIILKDVPQDKPMTKEVSNYFSNLVGREVPLICTFDGTPSKDGVYLKLHSGENINKIISEMLVPTWNKTGEEDKTCYLMNDLTVANLGKVGDILEVLVLYSIANGYKYAMCPLDYDLMTHIFDIMPKAMTEYCERTEFYIPREGELCLALFENAWYRAACFCRSETPTTSTVFFIDFGNVASVNHKDIRVMPKDFITPNALASVCKIVNLAPVQSDGLHSPEVNKRIAELVVPNNCVKVKIVKSNEEDGIYSVELPMIKAKLIEEGLV
ncbi:vreteno [Calliopsis andreniformis]|uniref:vreteno n=1 Tax=Calliopsis andreniformis TaxID=337506 RepID=UPI003FCD3AB2